MLEEKSYQKIYPKLAGKPRHKVMVIAHRGYSGIAPENTISAFKKAIEAGADMIELDIFLSKDGEIVVFHDKNLKRTTKTKGKVKDLLLWELKELDAGSWFKPEFTGERIPTLEEVLILTKGKIMVNIEIKADAINSYKKKGGIEEKLVKLIEKYDISSEVIISSYNLLALKRIKELNPNISTALLYRFRIKKLLLKIAGENLIDAFHPGKRFLNKKTLLTTKKDDFKINVYTINQKREMKKFIKIGVDGIITNYPDRLFELLREMKL